MTYFPSFDVSISTDAATKRAIASECFASLCHAFERVLSICIITAIFDHRRRLIKSWIN